MLQARMFHFASAVLAATLIFAAKPTLAKSGKYNEADTKSSSSKAQTKPATPKTIAKTVDPRRHFVDRKPPRAKDDGGSKVKIPQVSHTYKATVPVGAARPSGKDDAAPTKTSTRDGATAPAGGGTQAPATGTGASGIHNEISLTPVGPSRPAGGGDTVKTSTGEGSSAARRDSWPLPSPAAGDSDATAADALKGKTRSTGTDAASPRPAATEAAMKPATPSTAGTAPAAAQGTAPKSAATLSAVPAARATSAAAAVYSHNSSTMKFIPEGDVIRVIYDKPRDGLEPLGIKPGTPLFEGKQTGPNTYAGEATTFSRNCGSAKFPVAGQADGGVVTLRGEKPKRDSDCKVTGYSSETLVFEAKAKP